MTHPDVIPLRTLRPQRHSEVVEELRKLVWKAEGISHKPSALPFGVPAIDANLPHGGLATGALHEISPATNADAACAFGFIAALVGRMPQGGRIVIVVSRQNFEWRGQLHGHGLHTLGLDPARVIFIESKEDKPALWAMEEALRSGVPAAVIGVTGARFDFKMSQRLNFAASAAETSLLLLRRPDAAGSSAAATRWRVSAAPAARDRFGLITRWRWQLSLERCRNGRPGEWRVEYDHVAHCFSLAAALARPAAARERGPQALRHAYRS